MKALRILPVLFLSALSAFGQSDFKKEGLETQPWAKNFMENLNVGGYYRMYYFDRVYKTPYDGLGKNRQISVVDPTYFDPLLFMYIGGSPTANSSFGMELRVDNSMLGANTVSEGVFSMFNGLVLRANTSTKKAGNYAFRFGGIEWMNLTPFTFGRNTGFNRYSIFERRPWDPGGNVKQRPASYYHSGTINQDVRFGTNAFKGFVMDVDKLPYGITANVLYGFSQTYSGYDRAATVAPKKVYGAKISKVFDNKNELGVSTFNTISFEDSIKRNYDTRKMFHMVEAYSLLKFKKKANLRAEIGYGQNIEPQYDKLGGAAVMVDLNLLPELTKIPINLRGYHYGQYFINLDSYIGNTTTTPYLTNFYNQNGGGFQAPGARLTTPGDMVNNRQGLVVNSEIKVRKFKVIAGLDVSRDVNKFSSSTLSYGHRVNGLEISRLVQFPNNLGAFGPNNRMNTFYRGAYELVNISDTTAEGGLKDRLFYSSLDVQLKYATKIFNRDLYLFNLNTFASTGLKASILPMLSKEAYIQASYHEFEAYYHVWRDITFSAYYGLEFVKGSDKTDLDSTSTGARDQVGKSLGFGLDYQINNDVFLYVREKVYSFKDKNFETEKFSGNVFTVELKVFF